MALESNSGPTSVLDFLIGDIENYEEMQIKLRELMKSAPELTAQAIARALDHGGTRHSDQQTSPPAASGR